MEFLLGGRILASYLARVAGAGEPLVAQDTVQNLLLDPPLVWCPGWLRGGRMGWRGLLGEPLLQAVGAPGGVEGRW